MIDITSGGWPIRRCPPSATNLEAVNPASFWLLSDNSSARHAYEMSPVVEATLVFNMGQVRRRCGDLDAASRCYDCALNILQSRTSFIFDRHHTSHHHEMHPIMIPLLHNMGQLQYRRGDHSLVMNTYSLALRTARRMYGGNHPHVGATTATKTALVDQQGPVPIQTDPLHPRRVPWT